MTCKRSQTTRLKPLLALATTFFLAACSPTLTTLTGGTDDETWNAVTRRLCAEAWRPQTYSSRDTDQTQLEARANNAARDAYCGR